MCGGYTGTCCVVAASGLGMANRNNFVHGAATTYTAFGFNTLHCLTVSNLTSCSASIVSLLGTTNNISSYLTAYHRRQI